MDITKLIKSLRDLAKQIDDSEMSVIESISVGRSPEDQIAHMIETYPEVWGKGGTMRPWLEMKAHELGVNADWMPSDEGPFNSPNE